MTPRVHTLTSIGANFIARQRTRSALRQPEKVFPNSCERYSLSWITAPNRYRPNGGTMSQNGRGMLAMSVTSSASEVIGPSIGSKKVKHLSIAILRPSGRWRVSK